MPDYDVQPVALTAPPQPAYVTSYRPAVLVRNNGVHPAYAAGLLRIYTAGSVIFTTQLLSGSIAPGQEKVALGLEYWTPAAAGTYLVIATVTTDHDQVRTNDNLAPVTIIVSALPPPPPPGVTAHAAQHEENAADEIDLDGMRGLLADPQTATAHKTTHQAGGADQLDVTGLTGILATGQPIADHHEEHEDGGGDELYVGGLRGVLLDSQPSIVHDNAKHDPNFTTATEFGDHLSDTTKVHEGAKNLEQVLHKGAANGYAGLDAGEKVPAAQLGGPPATQGLFLRSDQTWQSPAAGTHSTSHESGGDDEISIEGLSGLSATAQTPASHGNATHSTSPSEPARTTITEDGTPGISNDVARSDHSHRGSGIIAITDTVSVGGTVIVLSHDFPDGFLSPLGYEICARAALVIPTDPNTRAVTAELLFYRTGQPEVVVASAQFFPMLGFGANAMIDFYVCTSLTTFQSSGVALLSRGLTGIPETVLSEPLNQTLGQGFAMTLALRISNTGPALDCLSPRFCLTMD